MPITFGSVGDIISVSLLIKDLVKSLDNTRGSSAEYQAVIRELWSLDHALLEVEVLFRSCDQTVELNALSATANECAEHCRKCITKFQERMRRYQKSLQSGGSGSFIRDNALKIRWQICEKEDLAKFRAEINAHCFSINMLLTTTGVTLANLKDRSLQTSLKQSEQSRTATQAYELAEIKSRLEKNNALIKAAASETREWSSSFDLKYFKNLGADILSYMQKIWKVNFLTYKAVISLQNSIPAQLERCWTQEPATLEDALGRITPVHLEFLDSWEAFEAVLEVRFRHLPGHRKIKQREYALRASALEKDIEQSLAFNRCFLPGQRIDMSMIFDGRLNGLSSCPGCNLVTSKTEEGLDSQVQCPRCKMWYQRVMETDTTESEPTSTMEPKVDVPDTELPMPRPRKRRFVDDEERDDNPADFRRVRLRYWHQSHESRSNRLFSDAHSEPNIPKGPYSEDSLRRLREDWQNQIPSQREEPQRHHPDEPGSFNVPRFDPADLNSLSHPIGTTYVPNAQLMYSSDEDDDMPEDELPDWNALEDELPGWNVKSPQSSPSADESAVEPGAFGSSVVNPDHSILSLDSDGVNFEEWLQNGDGTCHIPDFGKPGCGKSTLTTYSPSPYELQQCAQSESLKLQQIAAAFEKQAF